MNTQNYQILLPDFFERKVFIENAWCNSCDEANEGIFGPDECEFYGDKFIRGSYGKCGTKIVSEIIVKHIEE